MENAQVLVNVVMGLLGMVIVPWAVWVTLAITRSSSNWDVIQERCHGREQWLRAVDADMGNIKRTAERTGRNMVRLAMKLGVDKGELESQDE
jgi:hypothetical protein